MLPYAKIVAETFGETFPNFKTPVVESGGSGAGIKEFCKGVGENTIDIANASRAMKDTELKSCVDAGVKDVQEVRFGYDGIVFATDAKGPDWKLKPEDVYKALAAKVVVDGKLVDNPNTKWNQVNPNLPDWDIAAYILAKSTVPVKFSKKRFLLTAASTRALWTKSRRPVSTTRLPLRPVSQFARTARLSTSTATMLKRWLASTPTRPALAFSASTSTKTTPTS